MSFEEFEKIVNAKFLCLKCEETVDRKSTPIYATTDWRVVYNSSLDLWYYSEAKSRSASGKSLEESIANTPSLSEEF